ncbi:MAG: hypothetical protein ABSD20_05165 [Terriglobales bacterium]|jgi:hypothetical protein
MPNSARIRQWVDRILAQVFSDNVPGLRDELVKRVSEHLGSTAPEDAYASELRNSIASLHRASAQSDILRALLDGAAAFCTRAALFVVNANGAVGWQARGFRENDAIKLLTLDLGAGLPEQVVRQKLPADGAIIQFDARFAASFGAPADGVCHMAPLVVRGRVSALVYADTGVAPGGFVDSAALEILTQSAGTWIELLALRKLTASQAGSALLAASSEVVPVDEELAKPSAASVPSAIPAATGTTGEAPAVPGTGPVPVPAAIVPEAVAAAPSPNVPPALSAAAEDELHRKAKRFAKLLVDEIKLYNQGKVAEGKRNHDLYERLKTDIEKSRATYDKRYAQTVVASSGYFDKELVRNLAEENAALLGSTFPN